MRLRSIMHLEELKQQLGKITMPVAGGEPTTSQDLASYVRHVTHAAPGESWPVNNQGVSLLPLAQIVFAELSAVPPHLDDLQMVAVFVDPGAGEIGLRNGQGWLLRAYPKGQKLAPLTEPPLKESSVWHSLRWGSPITDMPPSPDYVPEEYQDLWNEFYEASESKDICSTAFKVGGYPRHLQWDIHFCDTVPNEKDMEEYGFSICDTRLPNPAEPVFSFQIASMHELSLCLMDMGIFYFGRGSGNHSAEWFAQIESH